MEIFKRISLILLLQQIPDNNVYLCIRSKILLSPNDLKLSIFMNDFDNVYTKLRETQYLAITDAIPDDKYHNLFGIITNELNRNENINLS